LIASVCAGGLPLATYGAPLLSSRLLAPSVYSLPTLATEHVTVARPSAVAVERVSVGSVPSVSVVNEPTTIVTPGKPIRGHSFTSEVRHDTVARYAPLVTYAVPSVTAKVVEAPAVSEVIETKSLAAPLAALHSEAYLPSVYASYPQTVISAPQVYATGPAQVVAEPASIKGYTRETGRTELVNELRLREASIPATIVQDHLVESVPTLVSQPLLAKTSVLGAPLLSTLIKK
jgi:hypothetical protein